MSTNIVIIGGVAAGATAAAKARRTSEDVNITLIEKGEHISFANCGLPYYAGGIIEDRDKILLYSAKKFSKRFNADVHIKTEATKIDRERRIVTAEKDGEVLEFPYDKVILCPGGRMTLPPIDGLKDADFFKMRTVEDADSVRKYLEDKKPESALIIGAGFIGVEIADAMRHAGLKVSIVEAAKEILPQYPQIMSVNVRKKMIDAGIDVHINKFAQKIEQKDGVTTLTLKDGTEINADMLFVATGVKPLIKLAEDAGLEIGDAGGIKVSNTMQTSDPDIYAAGDAVEKLNRITGRHQLLALAGPANREGRTAGNNAAGGETMRFPGIIGTSIVDFDGFALASTGLTLEQAQEEGFEADKIYTEDSDIAEYYPGYGFIYMQTVYDTKTGRVLGCSACGANGADKKIDVMASAIIGRLTVYDLEHFELCYSPQYGKAKDNVNIAGFVASNRIRNVSQVIKPEDFLAKCQKAPESMQILDVRTRIENKSYNLDNSINIPLDNLRDRADEMLDKSKPVYVYCTVGFRGYLAARTLRSMGYDAYNITGGIESCERVKACL